jgi:hypothetical protein
MQRVRDGKNFAHSKTRLKRSRPRHCSSAGLFHPFGKSRCLTGKKYMLCNVSSSHQDFSAGLASIAMSDAVPWLLAHPFATLATGVVLYLVVKRFSRVCLLGRACSCRANVRNNHHSSTNYCMMQSPFVRFAGSLACNIVARCLCSGRVHHWQESRGSLGDCQGHHSFQPISPCSHINHHHCHFLNPHLPVYYTHVACWRAVLVDAQAFSPSGPPTHSSSHSILVPPRALVEGSFFHQRTL